MVPNGDAVSLDARIEVVTPENIAVHYHVAGPMRRVLAFLIDTVLLMVMGLVVSILAGFAGYFTNAGFGMGLTLVSFFLLYWFGFGLQEAWFNGKTVGKQLLGLRVISVEGHPVNGLQSIMRNFLRLPCFMLPVLDLLAMTLSDRFQRLGDIVCNTVVVLEERTWLFGVAKLDDPRAIQLAAYVPANFDISRSLAKALSTYVERRRFFSPARRREVARHVAEPLLTQFSLPADTSYDLLLCALYYRAFIADRSGDEEQAAALTAASQQVQSATNPFATAVSLGTAADAKPAGALKWNIPNPTTKA